LKLQDDLVNGGSALLNPFVMTVAQLIVHQDETGSGLGQKMQSKPNPLLRKGWEEMWQMMSKSNPLYKAGWVGSIAGQPK
jgi:hypothetical protein